MLHDLIGAAARRRGRLTEAWYEQAVDRMVAAYVDWRVESIAAREAYSRYAATRGLSGRDAFAVYFAALDREERAAAEYAACVDQFYALASRHGGLS
jgi:hypothetical protein